MQGIFTALGSKEKYERRKGEIMRDTDYEILEEIRRSLPQDKAQEFNEAWENLKGKVEEQAYMEGYFYAIQVLEESLKNKNFRRH